MRSESTNLRFEISERRLAEDRGREGQRIDPQIVERNADGNDPRRC